VVRLPHKIGTMAREFDATTDHGRWWEEPDEDSRASALRNVTKVIQGMHAGRYLYDSLYTGLYENQPPYWVGVMQPQAPGLVQFGSSVTSMTRSRVNVLRRCVDTAASMLAKNPAEIRCETDGASWKLQKRARQQTKFVNGVLRSSGFHEVQKRTFVDGCLSRAGGIAKFSIDYANEKITCTRVHAAHVVWNDYKGEAPDDLSFAYPEARSKLESLYPDHADKIRGCTPFVRPLNQAYRRMVGSEHMADQVEVIESYHLAYSEDKPGRHLITIANCVLIDEEWAYDFFPIARFLWAKADQGWANSPMADQIIGYHNEVGERMRTESRAQKLACVPRVFIEQGSEIVEDEITNEIGGLVHYRGTPPTIAPATALPPEFYQRTDALIQKALADVGINEMQSAGQKPMGLDSGKALREYNDTGSARQILKGQAIELQTEDAGKIVFHLAKMLAEKCPGFAANALGARSFEKISWKDVDGDANDVRFRSNPVSALSSTTSGRIQDVTDLIKGGLLPPEEVQSGLGLKLLNFPDLEKVVTLETAMRELAEMQVDGALYDGEWIAPDPYQTAVGLGMLKMLAARSYYHALQMDGVPAKNVELLRMLMAEADALTQRLQGQPNIAQPGAAPPAPAPAPAQQSQISPPPMPVPMQAPGGPQ
jgi:hypothetical protein